MFNRGDQGRTPKQQADRAGMRMLARLGACGLLIYFMVQLLLKTRSETPGTQAPVIIAIVLLALTAVVIALTIIEFVRGVKAGAYNASTYEDAEIAEYLENKRKAEDGDTENNDSANNDEVADKPQPPEDNDEKDRH